MSRVKALLYPTIFISSTLYGASCFIFDRYWFGCVNGASMKPTLNSEWGLTGPASSRKSSSSRDWILIKRVKDHKNELDINDIVVFISPEEPRTTAIKRVKALPGQVYQPSRRDADGHVPTGKYIPKGHVWVEGDNAVSSVDSNMYGPIPMGLIRGKAVCVIFPKFKWL
ncbi:hypothetical protein C9374_006319 [Naegleria lovaniensis]|uniref:Mitochondrial inner membrane protease subunit 2 n=1 Tax=Naegleria lovaniensis TaxID=51637 RepID=A0AA88GNT1_NAELO|nr:uncharacterized protein C9374_006319 [Naegleria lovaniensis]KAG2381330.1 hypothetical protein C9374_006319 [Naegleria lovaniensis]